MRLTRTGRIVLVAGALLIATSMGYSLGHRRGWALGLVALLFYGTVMVTAAWSFAGLKRWSAAHPALDAMFFAPFTFFALLLVPALPWWVAALIALVAGVVFVPLVVRRRRRDGSLSR